MGAAPPKKKKRRKSGEKAGERKSGGGLTAGDGSGLDVFAVEALDPFGGDLFGASGGTFEGIGARTEAFGVHLSDHIEGAVVAFGVPLGHEGEVSDFCGDKEHGGGVFAGGDASATADADGGIEGFESDVFGDEDGVGFGSVSDVDGDVATGHLDAVKGRAIDEQVFDHGEGFGAPRFEDKGVAVFETAEVKLAGGGATVGAVGHAVDHDTAGSADPFAAIVFKGDGFFASGDQFIVERVEHLKDGHIGAEVLGLVGFEATFGVAIGLSPDIERQLDAVGHYL